MDSSGGLLDIVFSDTPCCFLFVLFFAPEWSTKLGRSLSGVLGEPRSRRFVPSPANPPLARPVS